MFRAKIKGDLFFDVPESLQRIYTNFEPCTTKLISENLQKDEVFVDIGANFGFFSILAASIIGSEGRVFSVEASPLVRPTLMENTKNFENIHILDSAVGNRTGTTEFYMTKDFVNSGVSLSPFFNAAEKISIPIDTLDNLLEKSPFFDGRVDFIKCDVQGDEIAVLEGARKTIEQNRNLRLIIEWAPAWMSNAGFDAKIFPAFLKELGFSNVFVVDDYLQKIMSIEEMEGEFRKDTTGKRFCNLFASK